MILPIILFFAGIIVATIYFIVNQRRAEQRNIKFREEIKNDFEQLRKDLPNIIEDGIPYLKNKKKQSIIKKGLAYLIDHKYEFALELFKQYVNNFSLDDSEKAAILNFIGIAYGENKEYEKSLEAFNKALEIDPRLAQALENKGVALYELGRFQEVLEASEKAISIDPNKAEFWSNKGAGLIKLDRLQDALKAFDKAIEINPNLSVTRYNIACIYSLTREKAKALEHLSNAISLGVKNKKRAKTDEDFKWLLEDEEFKRLTAD